MALSSIKAIITNRAAIVGKYGHHGSTQVDKALHRLIAADKKRGLTTLIFDLSDLASMTAVGATVVLGPQDETGAKAAVDAIHTAHQPDYIMLLDGPDVVPHISLHRISGITDLDTTTDSDLPYASPAGFSKQASAFLAVLRVVGRLPAARGEKSPARLISLIDASISHKSLTTADLASYFAISADKWLVSTQLSLKNVFGGHGALLVSPADGHTTIDLSLSRPVHLINCHGAVNDWRYYGEKAGNFPVAMETPGFAPVHIHAGSVIAAECCYGANLYDYTLSGAHPPLCLTYLWKGACAVMGSTNISYGPAASNGQADFMAQYFLKEILAGASTGRAMLQARQTFVRNQIMSNHLNLKTLAQFQLLGDPSLHPIVAGNDQPQDIMTADAEVVPKTIRLGPEAEVSERKFRRLVLDSEGRAAASSATKLGRRGQFPGGALAQFVARTRALGLHGEPKVFAVSGGSSIRATNKTFGERRHIAIVMNETQCVDEAGRELFPSCRAVIGHMLGDSFFLIEECESR
jgi:hypothetical protein